jgi:c-di-GMP-binding flagellar brake protein YcgR
MTDTQHQRRHLSRIHFDAEYRVTHGNDNEVYAGHVIDLSLKGVLIERPAKLSVQFDEIVMLDLILGEGDQHIRMQARVAHLHEHSMGVVCEHLDLESMTHLCRFLELNLGSHALLERELGEMLQIKKH